MSSERTVEERGLARRLEDAQAFLREVGGDLRAGDQPDVAAAIRAMSEAATSLEALGAARERALDEAIRAVEDERLMDPDPGCEGDRAYNLAVHDCEQAIRALSATPSEAAHTEREVENGK